MKRVVIADYGVGNLFSVRRAFENVGAEPLVTSDASAILNADRLVVPGVGAFLESKKLAESSGAWELFRKYAETERPILGICLGMQFFASQSREFGEHSGLNLIPGVVERISTAGQDDSAEKNRGRKVPHIGWSRVDWNDDCQRSTAFKDLRGEYLYFVHSYHLVPADGRHKLGTVNYEGAELTAAVSLNQVTGVQFHPERSGAAGLKFLKTFLEF